MVWKGSDSLEDSQRTLCREVGPPELPEAWKQGFFFAPRQQLPCCDYRCGITSHPLKFIVPQGDCHNSMITILKIVGRRVSKLCMWSESPDTAGMVLGLCMSVCIGFRGSTGLRFVKAVVMFKSKFSFACELQAGYQPYGLQQVNGGRWFS